MAAERDETVRLDGLGSRSPEPRSVPRLIDPAVLGGAVAGVYLLVTGIVAVARAQFATVGLFEPVVAVGGLPHTPLLGIVEIGLGVLALSAGPLARNGQLMTVLGVLMLVAGLVWAIEPIAFEAYLGVTRANGWQHTIVGAVLLVAGQVSPFTVGGDPARPYG